MAISPDSIIDRARAALHAHLAGELTFDEHLRPIKFVICHDGRLVAPVMVAMLEAGNTVLSLPRVEECVIEAQVTLERFEERGEGGARADRWRIYHHEPRDVNWAFVHLDAVRFEGAIIDGEAFILPNPLAREESLICREVNARPRERLRQVVDHCTGAILSEATAVGVDAFGLDIRGPFDVFRIPFPYAVDSGDLARQIIDEWFRTAQA